MPSTKNKKPINKLLKIDMSSGSDDDDSEHELSHYAKDKVKLMKEVLKLIKPKKIKSMAPDCIKNLDIVEINSMLLEELLGISNKRLQYIFNGENVDRETSSSESEEEKQPIDVISLDDISDDDDIELCISQNEKESLESGLSSKAKRKSHKVKTEPESIKFKNETTEKCKRDKKKTKKPVEPTSSKATENLKESEKEKLMSVLELLELQARARAIRSQLAIETDKKNATEPVQNLDVKQESESDSDAIIIDSPQHKEIVITSESEAEDSTNQLSQTKNQNSSEISLKNSEQPPQKKHKSTKKDIKRSSTSNEDQDKQIIDADATINTIDLTEKSKDSTGLDIKSRKEKLLTKIQKIKLVRNKNLSNIGRDVSQSSTEVVDSKECANKTTGSPISEAMALAISKEMSSENLMKGSEENMTSVAGTNTEDSENQEIQSVDVNTVTSDTVRQISIKNSPIVSQNSSFCDNDEIVINLDDDELDDMEND